MNEVGWGREKEKKEMQEHKREHEKGVPSVVPARRHKKETKK